MTVAAKSRRKPANLIYGLSESPPLWASLVLGLQHMGVISVLLVLPVIVVEAAGGTAAEAMRLVSASLIAAAVSTAAQAHTRGPVGSGYLCPSLSGPAYLAVSIAAVKSGGISLLLGMTLLAGVAEALFSSALRYLRVLFPPEVTGLLVAIVGISLVDVAVPKLLGQNVPSEHDKLSLWIAVLTLGGMIGFSVWGKGRLRLFCVVAGMALGYLAATAVGVLDADDWAQVSDSAWFDFPFKDHPGWSFDSALLVPFLLAMLGSSLKGVGDLTTCQKINDVDWKRPDMTPISRGILASSLGTITAGLLGGVSQSTSSSNVGLSIATGATSRIIAYTTAGFLLLFAFCPKLTIIFVIMPDAIMGATLIFVLSFMVAAGIQIIASRMLDNRKIFVVGVSLLIGLGVDIAPGAFAILPAWLQTLFSSSLSATLVLALGLNLIFRLGISSRASLDLEVGPQVSSRIFEFMQQQGGRWGARPEVIHRATLALDELMEGIRVQGLTESPVRIVARFDESSLDLLMRYRGTMMMINADPPSPEEMLEEPDRVQQLAGFLIRQYADRAECLQHGEVAETRLHFDH